MRLSLISVGLLALAICGETKITEWELTLHHDIQSHGDSNRLGGSGSVPVVDPPFHSAGYMPLNNTYDAELFYFYFQERSKDPDAPLLFWTNGGPGCSSLFGLFTENGPYVIQDDLTLRYREYGWDVGQNVIFLDHPVGTGFSKSGDKRDYVEYEDTVGQDVLVFFLEFMDLHPELRGKDLYLSGESYAGHYLPAIADAIYESNKRGEFMHLNLKGVLMGNPWTSPLPMLHSYADFAEMHGLISEEDAEEIGTAYPYCKTLAQWCYTTMTSKDCRTADHYCLSKLRYQVREYFLDKNPYDIRKKCFPGGICYDHTLLNKFLNLPSTQAQLQVNKTWVECDPTVNSHMRGDHILDMGPTVVKLLNAGLRILVYIGDQDFICNWMGNKAWIDSMVWEKSSQWTGTFSPWRAAKKEGGQELAGECESVEPLTFCKVFQSGHMVPMDQPEHAFRMLQTFISGDSFVSPAPTIMMKRAYHVPKEFFVVT